MKIITDPRCVEYAAHRHPERPQRVSATVDLLRAQKSLPVEWLEPLPVESSVILRAHSASHLSRVGREEDFDADTPAHKGIIDHALRSVGGALHALTLAGEGKRGFSLLRPPGHHATSHQAMGFCYLNSIAIAALEARARGFQRVAVFDFDVHHGNGTEQILLGRPDFAYFSVHQYPAYPGTGARSTENSHNYPVAPGSARAVYRASLERAFADLLAWKPDVLGVSAGFDAYRGDPLSDAALEDEDFYWLGEIMRQSGLPTFSVLEGGYSSELPNLILAYLKGLEGAAFVEKEAPSPPPTC
jgi:acetoin utilization deacetylase AcuC-like enzyme